MNSIEIQKEYKVSALIAQVLEHRKLEQWQIDQILNPTEQLHFSHCEALNQVAQRIMQAKERKEKVLISGDYDADGLCATTILKETLDQLDIVNGFYIPDRLVEGYGLNVQTVQMAAERGYSLIITIDNGITAEAAIDMCHALGIDILVTDHHTKQNELKWTVLLHPEVMESHFAMMCGAGVALQVSHRLLGENKKHVILAMVATLADMVPLFHENRTIVRLGLRYLNELRLPQLERLLDRPVKTWNEQEIAFQIIPKLNAVGRLADFANPNNVVRWLILDKESEIEGFAKQIKAINEQRKQMAEEMTTIALSKAQFDDFMFVADESFHEGLVGLVANRLIQQFACPVAVLAMKENTYKGSIRGGETLDLIDFFEDLKPYLETFGGHQKAVGIEIRKENFEAFQEAVKNKMKTVIQMKHSDSVISVVSSKCTPQTIYELDRLAPFGQGFELPRFELTDFEVLSSQVLKEKYPKWKCCNEEFEFESISFNLDKTVIEKPLHSFVGTLQVNEFWGKKTVTILVDKVN